MPLSPLSCVNIYHRVLSEVSVPVISQPAEAEQIIDAAQPTEVAAHPSDSSIAQLPHLTLDIPPQMPLASASAITQRPRQLVSNYNNVGADQHHGVTDIQ